MNKFVWFLEWNSIWIYPWNHVFELENGSLESMSFSIFSMHSNIIVFLRTMDAKAANIIIVPDVVQMHSTYSIKPLGTRKMYTICDAKAHVNNVNPKSIRLPNTYFWIVWGDELIPKVA